MYRTMYPWIAGAVLLSSAAAQAEVTATVSLTTDYLFDGVSQTQGDPALQGSIDYAHEDGWYAGVWASNVNYALSPDYRAEVDYYIGYAGEKDGIGYDISWLRYTYPGLTDAADVDYNEVRLALSKRNTTLTMWRSGDYANSGTHSFIWKINHDIELNKGVTMHLEYDQTQTKDNIGALPNGEDRVSHYRIGFSRDFSGTTLDISYHNHSEDSAAFHVAQPTWAATISRTFTLLD